MNIKNMRTFSLPGKWTVHSYYSLNPYAPDGSGRLLCAGCDVDTGIGEVFVLDADGKVLDRFGKQKVSTIFFHTGFWQAWGKDAKKVCYQASDGDVLHPRIAVHDLETGLDTVMDADMEGAPIYGEPVWYGLSGMYYASGYGDGRFHPEQSPVPFGARDEHGLFAAMPSTGEKKLVLSVNEVLERHPFRDRILEEDEKQKARTGDGVTLMIYCARCSRDGERVMFHFGNHCTDHGRGEPHLLTLFTAKCHPDGSVSEVMPALDLSFGRTGVHWSWLPHTEGLIGYASEPGEKTLKLMRVDRDGQNLRTISDVAIKGGHPSMSPCTGETLYVTDGWGDKPNGRVQFLNAAGEEIESVTLPKSWDEGQGIPRGRNRFFVCHHPVFNADGTRLLVNTMPGREAQLCEMEIEY